MKFLIDLDPTHRVLRTTIAAAVLTEKLLDDFYQELSLVAYHGGPYAAISDFSGVTDTTLSADAVRDYARRDPPIPGGRTRVAVARASDIRICSYGPANPGSYRDTISGRPFIGGSLQPGRRVPRRLQRAYLPEIRLHELSMNFLIDLDPTHGVIRLTAWSALRIATAIFRRWRIAAA